MKHGCRWGCLLLSVVLHTNFSQLGGVIWYSLQLRKETFDGFECLIERKAWEYVMTRTYVSILSDNYLNDQQGLNINTCILDLFHFFTQNLPLFCSFKMFLRDYIFSTSSLVIDVVVEMIRHHFALFFCYVSQQLLLLLRPQNITESKMPSSASRSRQVGRQMCLKHC